MVYASCFPSPSISTTLTHPYFCLLLIFSIVVVVVVVVAVVIG